MMAALYEMGVGSVMVEGGATLITALLRERLVDRVCVCIAPKILGSGIEAVGNLGIRKLDDSLALTDAAFIPQGSDLILDARISYPDAR
jgi:5-amino-6-(5-phosphoribosylamino)uracil reductase/diaminohydroxyphosphoribosylaminopyrimidine deaminase/5-amino-6-(5-phosphoribosylamino)uracil reductase